MTAYLGPVGTVVPIAGSSSLKTTTDRQVTTQVTLGGVRKAQLGRGAHREWDVTIDTAEPSEAVVLDEFLRGAFGPGPFWWVSEQAVYSNLLTPRVAGLEQSWRNTVHGGPVRLPGGAVAGRSLIVTGATVSDPAVPEDSPGVGLRLPCVPGVPVTASAWLSGQDQRVRVQLRDVMGGNISAHNSDGPGSGGLRRVAVTAVPPPNAHHLVLQVVGTGRLVRPAVTWTDGVRDYGAGAGCAAAILAQHDTTTLHRLPGPIYLDSSYTILEVGS